MRKFAMILLLFVTLTSAYSQKGNVNGIIRFEDGQPAVSAIIQVREINKNGITDIDGKYLLSELPYGQYTLDIRSIEAEDKTLILVVDKPSQTFDIPVRRAVMNLSEVLVSSVSRKRDIETRGFAVNVIETQKTAVQSVQTNELLDRTAGVRIRQDGGMGSRINYNINGMSGDAVKIFIDGMPASNFGSSFSLNSIPPSLIERIEIYKGVVPGYLAEDALGGAINIVLKQRRSRSLSTSYSAGSFNTHKWDINGNYRWKNGLTLDMSAFYNYSDNNYKVWGEDIYFVDYQGVITESEGKKVRRFHDAYSSAGLKAGVGFTDVKWADQFLLGAILSQDYKEVQHGATMRVVYGDRHTRRNSAVITLKYLKKNFLTEGLTLSLDAAHSYLKRQAIDTVGIMHDWAGPIRYPDGSFVKYSSGAEVGSAKTLAINRDDTNTARLNLDYAVNDNNRIYFNYLLNDFQRDAYDPLEPPALQKLANTRDLQKNIVSFTYENLAFDSRLRTNLFYKHYFQKVTSNEPYLDAGQYKLDIFRKYVDYGGYGLTFSYALRDNFFILGSAEKTLRLPNANELFGNVADNLLPPSKELEPERSFNANLGFNYRFSTGNHYFNTNASFFYRDTKGMIREAIRTGSFVYTQFENLEDVMTRGVDAELNYNYSDRFSFRFNISKFDVLFNTKYDAQGNPYLFYRMQIRNEPSLKFSTNLSYKVKNLLLDGSETTFHFNSLYVKGFLRNWPNVGSSNLSRIPTQYPIDLGLAYTFPSGKFVLSCDVKNIANIQVYDNFGLQKPGRAVYAKLSYFIL
jgi:outer membrane receptor protein involved in Fe transport